MKKFFVFNAFATKHCSMNKSHAPHPSLPKGLFLSSQWPVVATRLGKAAIISSEDEQRVFPESEEKNREQVN